jgi:threonyl-tRNA synthetase
METTMQYRDEKPGEIGGLTRVRSITVDDGHIFCRPDQIKQEAKNIAHIIERFYEALGLFGDHWVSLSVRDPASLDDYIGDDEDWDQAESMLADVSDELGLEAERIEGEAAIYGPKLDYMFEDSLGREWQLATIQIDFAMPKRFELTYTTEENEKATPVMIHRAILGSYERFMAVLIEHFGGDFPLWLAPEQVRVLPISDDQQEYANEVYEQLKDSGLRAAIDASDETLGKKIRNLNQKKVPYFIVIGDDEVESGTVTLEDRTDGTVGMMDVDEVCEALQKEITNQAV